MKGYNKHHNGTSKRKIDDRGMIIMLVLYLFSPLLVLVLWLFGMHRGKEYISPIAAVQIVYRDLYKWWRELI
jgi:hypothetical protein